MTNANTNTSSLTDQELTKVQDILIEELGVKREQLTLDARLIEDLGADSLSIVEIGIRVEEEFSLVIPDERMERLQTVESVYDLLGALLHGEKPGEH